MEELWAEIDEVPTYAISNFGNVQNLKTGRILKPSPNSYGYPQVSLCFGDGTYVKRTTHSLVAKAFVDGYRNGLQVNHRDTVKVNSKASNLEWVTQLENMQHARRMGLFEGNSSPGFGRTPVMIVETGEVFKSQYECAKSIGGYQTHISACLYGRLKSHRGYTFKFVNID